MFIVCSQCINFLLKTVWLADQFSLLMKLVRNGEIDSALVKLREWYPQIVQVDCLRFRYGCVFFRVVLLILYSLNKIFLGSCCNFCLVCVKRKLKCFLVVFTLLQSLNSLICPLYMFIPHVVNIILPFIPF